MNIQILGGGWYGCHLALTLLEAGHAVTLLEKGERLFAGASGANPARLHVGFHYPRSQQTRRMCQETHAGFMARYGFLTRSIPCNIYAIAAHRSLIDFGTYLQVLRHEVQFVELERPEELGLTHVEGAILTGERHILIEAARAYFTERLAGHVLHGTHEQRVSPGTLTIDCTFCSQDAQHVDRFEPCITGLLKGPTHRAVTIMDGPFPSLYPWDEEAGLNSLTSALFTPLGRYKTYSEARAMLDSVSATTAEARMEAMRRQLAEFWPESYALYEPAGYRLAIRAMPFSGADARLVDVLEVGPRSLRIRAGKIDAIVHAETLVKEMLCSP